MSDGDITCHTDSKNACNACFEMPDCCASFRNSLMMLLPLVSSSPSAESIRATRLEQKLSECSGNGKDPYETATVLTLPPPVYTSQFHKSNTDQMLSLPPFSNAKYSGIMLERMTDQLDEMERTREYHSQMNELIKRRKEMIHMQCTVRGMPTTAGTSESVWTRVSAPPHALCRTKAIRDADDDDDSDSDDDNSNTGTTTRSASVESDCSAGTHHHKFSMQGFGRSISAEGGNQSASTHHSKGIIRQVKHSRLLRKMHLTSKNDRRREKEEGSIRRHSTESIADDSRDNKTAHDHALRRASVE
jgi:hypothetical protein